MFLKGTSDVYLQQLWIPWYGWRLACRCKTWGECWAQRGTRCPCQCCPSAATSSFRRPWARSRAPSRCACTAAPACCSSACSHTFEGATPIRPAHACKTLRISGGPVVQFWLANVCICPCHFTISICLCLEKPQTRAHSNESRIDVKGPHDTDGTWQLGKAQHQLWKIQPKSQTTPRLWHEI